MSLRIFAFLPNRRALLLAAVLCAFNLCVAAPAQAQEAPPVGQTPAAQEAAAVAIAAQNKRRGIIAAADEFFGDVSHGVAEAIEKAAADLGVPTGYIAGEEVSAGFIGGLRYGSGTLVFTDTQERHIFQRIYWQGPSVGVDVGANVSKVFILVYNLRDLEDIYGRRPMAQAGVYVGAGGDVGVDHLKSVTLVPVYSGVGVRLGARLGYVKITPKRQWFPL
ncbi:DUF1134 domain-containing protein [Pedomonas mirosovicensis]|uniref:DUF1134 domain-containing protein n=1 Tax=Pedomonas mirosovicensis TaxID=2908641 RepID=UPI002167F0E8|nr:DUF1134 domain-containing protein [Pedomonas mirosovicensis]MCH8686787.1 DUF1134 domain-containing protein [Pedomonas mirosovicensis]